MIFRKLLTRKAVEVVEAVAEPARKAVADQIEIAKKAVGDRSDWGAKVTKFGIALIMLLMTFRDDRNDILPAERLPMPPGNITINNYVNDHRERSDAE
jgi:hypothetical protein